MIPEMIDEIMREHPDEHMVQPKNGIYFTNNRIWYVLYFRRIKKPFMNAVKKNNLYLFIDGARLEVHLS